MIKSPVSYSDFAKFDFRVGTVIKAEKVKEADKLIRMNVDLGPDYGIRTIFAGVAQWYKASQLKGKKLIIVANLEPKKMFNEESQGMMMAADIGGKAVLISVSKVVPEGSVVR